jgi:hypothetical protein
MTSVDSLASVSVALIEATDVAMVPTVVCETSEQAESSFTTIRQVAGVDETALVRQLDIEELFSSTAVENFAVMGSNFIEPEAGNSSLPSGVRSVGC